MPDQPPLNPDALAQLIMWEELPFGGNPDNYIRLDANAAHAVIELLKPHLAAAQPVMNSVEVIPAQVQTISWESNPEHDVWTLEQDQTFVGLVVDAQRGWSMADKITLHIERPAVES